MCPPTSADASARIFKITVLRKQFNFKIHTSNLLENDRGEIVHD
jgi:hypothetical protein